jgi:hypothetical protein
MTGYLLDTNVVSDLVRNPQGTVAQRIRKVGETKVCTSIIVASELRYGAEKKGSQRLTTQLEVVLGALQVLPFDSAGFEHSLSGSANRSAATTCSSLLMLLRLVIPWLATTPGSLLRCEDYNERTGFVPLKGKILFLSNSVQPKGMSTRREGRALCKPA